MAHFVRPAVWGNCVWQRRCRMCVWLPSRNGPQTDLNSVLLIYDYLQMYFKMGISIKVYNLYMAFKRI